MHSSLANLADVPVAIYIPTYNRVGLLEIAIKSALGQTHPNVHVYVSDNASEDGTQDLCESLQSHSNFTYMRFATNQGGAVNVATLLGCSNEPWFCLLGDDDFLDTDFVEKTLAFALANACVNVVGSVVNYVNGEEHLRDASFFLGDQDPLLRLFCFHHTTNTNALFYGLRRNRKIVLGEAVPGSDWTDTYSNIYHGNVAAIDATHLHREMTKWLEPKDFLTSDMFQSFLSDCGYTPTMLQRYKKVFNIADGLFLYYAALRDLCPKNKARAFIYLIFCIEWWRINPDKWNQIPDLAGFLREIIVEAREQGSKTLSRFKDLSNYLFDWRKSTLVEEDLPGRNCLATGELESRLTVWDDLLNTAHRLINGKDAGGVFNSIVVSMAAEALLSSSPPPKRL